MDEEIEKKEMLKLRLAEGRKKYQEMKAQGLVEQAVRLSPGEKAKAQPSSLRKAVTAHCWDCMGGEHSENVRQLVRECSVEKCFLHGHRPWQKREAVGEEE